MTNNLFIWPWSRIASVGDTLTFYDSGTTTPKSVYAEAGLTTSLGATLTADIDGNFTQAFLGNSAYKVLWKSSTGVSLGLLDPYARETQFAADGDLDMKSRSIENVADPVNANDVANMAWVQAEINKAKIDLVAGTRLFTGNLEFGKQYDIPLLGLEGSTLNITTTIGGSNNEDRTVIITVGQGYRLLFNPDDNVSLVNDPFNINDNHNWSAIATAAAANTPGDFYIGREIGGGTLKFFNGVAPGIPVTLVATRIR